MQKNLNFFSSVADGQHNNCPLESFRDEKTFLLVVLEMRKIILYLFSVVYSSRLKGKLKRIKTSILWSRGLIFLVFEAHKIKIWFFYLIES